MDSNTYVDVLSRDTPRKFAFLQLDDHVREEWLLASAEAGH